MKKGTKKGAALFSVSILSGAVLLLCLHSGVMAMLGSSRFLVQEIELQWPASMKRPPEHYRLRPARSIFNVDLRGIEKSVQGMFPTAEVLAVERRLPNHLIVRMNPRQVVAQIKLERFYPVSEQAVVVGAGRPTPWPNLPILSLEGVRGPLTVGGSFKNEDFQEVCSLLAAVGRLGGIFGHRAASVRTVRRDMILSLDSGTEIRFNIERLRRGWEQLTELMLQKRQLVEQARYIDLRFEDPVVSEGKKDNRGKGKR